MSEHSCPDPLDPRPCCIAAYERKGPGKFEGEPSFVAYLWDQGMHGFHMDYDGDWIAEISPEDRARFPELEGIAFVRLWEDDNGFVYHTTLETAL